MPGSSAPDLLLFVAGEPYSGVSDLDGVETSVLGRAGGFVVGTWVSNTTIRSRDSAVAGTGGAVAPDWHLPRAQTQCAELAVELAREKGLEVLVVDVNRAGALRDLVARWVRADDLFPLLVRPDGSRLEGEDEFIPSKIRKFLRTLPDATRGPRFALPSSVLR
jgi:hypothetical protein